MAGDNRLVEVGDSDDAWVKVDRIPRAQEAGRPRFFRDRRPTYRGCPNDGNIEELPIPEEAGLVEPKHVVLSGHGLIASYGPSSPLTTCWVAHNPAPVRTPIDDPALACH